MSAGVPGPVPKDPISRFWARTTIVGRCIEWTGNRSGNSRRTSRHQQYGRFAIKVDGAWRSIGAHRWIYERCVARIPPGKVVMHACDNPACVKLQHLEIGTQSDNMQDAMNKGRLLQMPPNVCAVCEREFMAKHSRGRAKICSPECLREWGRRCAARRWQRG